MDYLGCRDRLVDGIQGTSDEEENRGQFPLPSRGQPVARSRRAPICPVFFTTVVARQIRGSLILLTRSRRLLLHNAAPVSPFQGLA